MTISSRNLFTAETLRRWLLVLVVGLVALASYWVLEIISSRGGYSVNAARTRPDYYVDNFNYVKMLPNGQNKYRVVGSKLVHYPEDDHAEVTLPMMSNLDPTQPPMTMRSMRAVIKNMTNKAENEVHLYEKVVVNRPKTALDDHLQLNTNYLMVYPDKNTMETHLPVEIIYGDTITTGVGMKADNNTRKIEILSTVHSVIPPHNEQKKATATK